MNTLLATQCDQVHEDMQMSNYNPLRVLSSNSTACPKLQRCLVLAFAGTRGMTLTEITCQCRQVGRTGATIFALVAGFFTSLV